MKFKNENNISKITMKLTSKNYCPLGSDWYTNQFTVEFIPGEYLCDYLDVISFTKDNINEEKLIVEDSVARLFDYMLTEYNPVYLKVSSLVVDAVHPEVLVEKETK